MKNPKNKTKLGFVFKDKLTLDKWYRRSDGLFGAIRELSKDFNIKVFGYSDVPAVIGRDTFEIQLSDNLSSIRYWIRAFSPPTLVCIGDVKDEVLDMGAKLVFPSLLPCADTDRYEELDLRPVIPGLSTIEKHINVLPAGSFYMGEYQRGLFSGFTKEYDPIFLNQCAFILTDDAQVAVDALACNRPTLTVSDTPASHIQGVWVVGDDPNSIKMAWFQLVMSHENESIDLRQKFVTGKQDHIVLSERIGELL